jgi:hypothetical protein
MKQTYAIAAIAAAVLIALAAAYLFLQWSAQPSEIPPAEFRKLLNATNKVAIVQDLRTLPPDDTVARSNLQNCAIQLSMAISSTGKNVSNYAFEGSSCYGGASSSSRPVADCLKEIGREKRLLFSLSFNSAQNKTRLTAQGADYFGDAAFLSECSITGIVR